jgi:hypothetical protein
LGDGQRTQSECRHHADQSVDLYRYTLQANNSYFDPWQIIHPESAEVTRLAASLDGTYGKGKYCPPGDMSIE